MKTTRNISLGKRPIISPSGIVLFIMILFWIPGGQKSFGQGVGISEISITPDPSSILELRSTLKGFLAPRLTTLQRLALGSTSPARGLLVYDTNTKSFWYYEGGWKAVMGAGTLGTSNQLLGMNAAGDENEYKTLNGSINILVSHTIGNINLTTSQDIHPAASPTFAGLKVSSLAINSGVYTDAFSFLTTTPPPNGILGYWSRSGNILSPATPGDFVTTSGNIYTTGTGAITSAGLLTGSLGATISGGAISLNNNSNFVTNINTGSSTGAVTIGGTGTQTISVGDGAGLKTLNLGSNNTTSSTKIMSGTGGAMSLNASAGGAVTNIGTGTTTGGINIGSTTNKIYLPEFTAAGVLHNDVTTGLVTSSKVSLTADISGVLLVPNGGTGLASGISGGIPYFSSNTTMGSSNLLTANALVIGGGAGTAPSALILGSSYQLLGMNIGGTANEYKTLNGVLNRIIVTNAPGSITISTPQDIHTGAVPTFAGLTVSDLAINSGVYTDGSRRLTSFPPTSGVLGYWSRSNNKLTPTTVGDTVATSGNIYTTGTGAITSAGLLKGLSGATISGGAISLNNSSNFATNINTGSSTGAITIGNSANTITLPAFNTAGVVHNNASGLLSSSLIVNSDIANNTIDLLNKVTNVLPIANGGTNSSTALSGSSIIISNGTSIIQGDKGTTTTVLHGNAVGAPSYGLVVNADIANSAVDSTKLGIGSVWSSEIRDGEVKTVDIANDAITTAKILNANVTPVKIAPGLINQVLVTDALGAVAWINRNTFGAIADQLSIEGDGTLATPFKVKDLGIVTSMLASGAVTNAKLASDAVLTGNIFNETILSEDIKDGEVKTADIANSAVDSTKLGIGSVWSSEIRDGEVKTVDIANDAITTAKILNANVTPIKIAPGLINQVLVTDALGAVAWINRNIFGAIADQLSIEGDGTLATPFKVKDLGIVTSMLSAGAVTNAKLAADAVLTGNIFNETILSEDIKDGEVKTADIANSAVDSTKLGIGSVWSSEIRDGEVKTVDIANDAITTAKILNANVTPIKIAPGLINQVLVTDALGAVAWINRNIFGAIADQLSIEGDGTLATPFKVKDLGIVTSMLSAGAVTNAKLAADAVLTGNIFNETILSEDIKDGEVKTADIANSAVDSTKLGIGSVWSSEIRDGEVKTVDIANDAITTAKILNANVTPIKIAPGLINQVLVTDALGAVAWINRNTFGAIADQLSIEGDGTLANPFKVKDLGIVTSMLSAGAVTNAKLAADAVLTGNIFNETILSEDIKDGEVKTADIANSAVDSTKLGIGSVWSSEIRDGEVKTVDIANDAITTAKILNANVTPIKIAPGLINQVLVTDALGAVAWINRNIFGAIADQLSIEGDGTLATPFKVKDLGIVTSMLAAGAVTNAKLASDAVLTGNIFNETILSEDIKDGEVKTADIANSAVDSTKLGIGSVWSSEIRDGEVKTVDIANNAVSDAKFRQGVARSVVGVTGNALANVADIAGTTDQVLRVDGAGAVLAFGSIDLSKSATVGTSILPIANGGTGASSQNFVDLTSNQSIGGTKTFIGTISAFNLSGTNTGDNAVNTLYSSLVTNATHTGDATGAAALTVVGINGTSMAGLGTGILKNTTGTGVPSIAISTDFPTLNQNTTGSAASFTGSLAGEVTGTQGSTVVGNSAVIGKVLTGYTSGAGTVAATDNILEAIQKLNGNDATNANLTGMVTSVGNATTVVTNANLTGEVTSLGNTTTVTNDAVIGKVLTGYTSGAGTVAATDNILQAIQKIDGNATAGANATHTGDATGATALTVVGINGTSMAGLGTGILKNTTGTGVPSIAISTDFPTLNQNTTGSAASFTGSLAGEVTGTQGSTVVGNSAVIGKVLTGYTSGAGTVAATDNILEAIQKLNGNDATNANLTGMVTSVGNATTVVTNANLTGEVTSLGNATTVTNAAVIGKVLTGYTSGAGTVAATDNILEAIQKLNGNDATNANLTGEVTSVGNATTVTNAAVIGKVLTGFTSGAGTVAATDNILQAIQKIDGNATAGANATHTGDATGATALTVVGINGTSMAGLGTGILKNTTGTGVPSIAISTDFPTLNQNTTGSAASFTGSLAGEVTGTQGSTVVGNSAVIGKVLTGYTSGAGTVAATDNILEAIQKLNGNDATNANLTGEVTSVGNAATVTNAAVISKLLTGYVSSAGTVAATDNILQAIQKLNGNDATNANLTGMVTSVGNATTVVTNANLTGDVTSVGNATTVASVGGSSSANVNSATLLSNAATNNNTASAIVRRDASGNFIAGTITGALAGNATTATTATNFSGSLSGDVTGTQGATLVSAVGGSTAVNINAAVVLANEATTNNTASTIVRRDATGNFTAGTITAALSGNATTATTATHLGGGAQGSIPYQTAANTTTMLAKGTAGQVLAMNPGATAPQWQNAGAGDMILAAVQTVSGAKTFSTTLTALSDITIDATSSTTVAPRTVGINGWAAGSAARYTFGDPWNALQNAYGDRMQLTAYWGVDISGNTQLASARSFGVGAGSDASLNVIGTTVAAPVLTVTAAAGQTGNLQEWRNSGGTALASVSSTGQISTSGGATINGAFNYGVDNASNDTYTIALTPAPTAYVAGMMVIFKANTSNTNGATMNVNSLGNKNILRPNSAALSTNDILANGVYILVYDGTNFYLIQ